LQIKEVQDLSEERVYKNRIRLENPRNTQKFLARIINELHDGTISESKARVMGYIAQIMLKSFETIDFEERLKEIEKSMEDKK
jgi:hypothetical protein